MLDKVRPWMIGLAITTLLAALGYGRGAPKAGGVCTYELFDAKCRLGKLSVLTPGADPATVEAELVPLGQAFEGGSR